MACSQARSRPSVARDAPGRDGPLFHAAEGVGRMSKGTVKWFNDSRGYGFIARPEGDDLFVHFSAIITEGFRTLTEGEEVEFELAETENGFQAANVVKA